MITLTQAEGKYIAKVAKGFFADDDLELENEIEMESLRQKLSGSRFIKEEVDWTILKDRVTYHPVNWRELEKAIQSGEVRVI